MEEKDLINLTCFICKMIRNFLIYLFIYLLPVADIPEYLTYGRIFNLCYMKSRYVPTFEADAE